MPVPSLTLPERYSELSALSADEHFAHAVTCYNSLLDNAGEPPELVACIVHLALSGKSFADLPDPLPEEARPMHRSGFKLYLLKRSIFEGRGINNERGLPDEPFDRFILAASYALDKHTFLEQGFSGDVLRAKTMAEKKERITYAMDFLGKALTTDDRMAAINHIENAIRVPLMSGASAFDFARVLGFLPEGESGAGVAYLGHIRNALQNSLALKPDSSGPLPPVPPSAVPGVGAPQANA